VLSSVTIFFLVFGIVSLGIGFGAIYPNFKHENIAKVATGFGGLMYMITSSVFIALVVVLEAGPVYTILSAHFKGEVITHLQWFWIVSSFILALILIIIAVKQPLAAGLKALDNYEG
jgi:ABC-2 type transport system permease protein